MTSRNFSTASNQLQEDEFNEVNEYVLTVAVPTVEVSSTPLHHKSVSVEGDFCSSSDSSRTEIFIF
jgi:hypothetical protein